jgi:hypothetical protein
MVTNSLLAIADEMIEWISAWVKWVASPTHATHRQVDGRIGSFASNRAASGTFRSSPESGNATQLRTLQQRAMNGLGFHAAPQISSLAFDHCPALRVP